MRYEGLIGPAYQSASPMADTERCLNLYLETTESPSAPSPACLLPTPGFEWLVTVPEGPIRCLVANIDGRCFFIAGYRLYEWDHATRTATARGTVASDSNPATMCWNGPNGGELFITSGDVGYILTLATNTLATVLASGATMGAFLSGRFLALDATTATFQISNLFDGLTWDPTQVVQRSAGADPWVAMTVVHNEIWLMGSETSEVWYDAGAFPFPFQPIPGAFIEWGIAAPFSANRDVAPLLWVGHNAQGARVVLQANGYTATRVSTHGIEAPLARYATVAHAESFVYQDQGHLFYVVTCPGETTWVYDVTERAWHERGHWHSATSTWEVLRVCCGAYDDETHLVGDRERGTLYRMSTELSTDVTGEGIRRLRQPPRISNGQTRFVVHSVWLVMDVGVGLSTGQGSDPQVMRRCSRDGGKTWGPERWVSMGKQGEYSTRVIWFACGQARNYGDEFSWTDPVPVRLVDGHIDLTMGTS